METGEGRYWVVKLWVFWLLLLGELTAISANAAAVVFTNSCPVTVFPSLFPDGGSLKIRNRTSLGAIVPNGTLPVPLPDNWSGVGYIRTGCISDGFGGFHNCTTGDCLGRVCALCQLQSTVEELPRQPENHRQQLRFCGCMQARQRAYFFPERMHWHWR